MQRRENSDCRCGLGQAVNDNCDTAPVYDPTKQNYVCSDIGTKTATVTVKDDYANLGTCTSQVCCWTFFVCSPRRGACSESAEADASGQSPAVVELASQADNCGTSIVLSQSKMNDICVVWSDVGQIFFGSKLFASKFFGFE